MTTDGSGNASFSVTLSTPPLVGQFFTATATDSAGNTSEFSQISSGTTVTNTNDSGPGSLRQAILNANANPGSDTISFAPGLSGTIVLTSGELQIINDVTIVGPGANLLTIDGNDASRIFNVDDGNPDTAIIVAISGLTLTRGNAGTANGGGAIFNDEDLTLTNSTLSGNSAGFGGGILNYDHGKATLTNSTLSDNSAGGSAGAFENDGEATLINSTLSRNSAGGPGGGIKNLSGATLTLTNSTLSDNSAGSGGGIFNNGTATLNNTIVANSPSGGDLDNNSGTLTGSHNLIEDGSGGLAGTITGDPKLGLLAPNGGPTQTMALLPGSPAIDAGTTGTGVPTTDQRGLGRVGNVDIGAVESQGYTLTVTSGTPQTALAGATFATPLAISVTPNYANDPVNGGVVTLTPPASGASASLSTTSATISGGSASVTATANGLRGAYTVTASASEGNSANFSLTNVLQPTFAGLNSATTTYGTPTVTFTGTLAAGTTAATGSVTVTISGNGITALSQSASLDPNGNFSATFNTAALPANPSSPYTVTYDYAAQDDFLAATDPTGTLTVGQRALTVTASDQSKTYGEVANLGTTAFTTSPVSTGVGLVNGDTVASATLTSAGSAATATVGGYAITASNATGTGLSNYSITYATGTLTVGQRALTVTASDQSKTYGEVANLGTTAFTTSPVSTGVGLVNGDTVTSVTLTSAGAAAPVPVAGSPYAIVASAAVGTGLSNYTISYDNGSLTVNTAPLTITPTAGQSKGYGAALPALTYTASGFVNGDPATLLTGASAQRPSPPVRSATIRSRLAP